MTSIKTKAIFYAYSNNALDHLAPYAVLCSQKKISCTVIFGEDFIKQKVRPKNNIIKIFAENNIKIYNISKYEKKGFLQVIFSNIWFIVNFFENNQFIPKFIKDKTKGLLNRIYEKLDGELIGINTAKKILDKGEGETFLIFIDHWAKNKKIQNGFLSYVKKNNNITIISVHHAVWHVHEPASIDPLHCEDIVLASNHWEADCKKIVKRREITGCLRFSKPWLSIIDLQDKEEKIDHDKKKKILVLSHSQKYTTDWNRMMNFLTTLAQRNDINLRILPHVRGMSNLEPPKILKDSWDKNMTLDAAVKKSDIVLFWESSGIFEAVVRRKKVFFLSFLSERNGQFIWQEMASSKTIIQNELELFDALDNYDNNKVPDNICFEKMIWPGTNDPWTNVSNFLDKLLNSNTKFNN